MPTAVTVIVPVYNPGPYLRPLLDALDHQHPVADGFDAILVDDGSDDGTAGLLDHWTGTRPWARVIHQPNSGWPSRPRNVGLAAAQGRYVFFVDHDDALTDDALHRMVAFAGRTEADAVLGRMRSAGRKVPSVLFARTVEDARPPAVPLADSMTTHAMFRRAFLIENAITFDESVRRMEDHLFMAEVYTRARKVSVYADADVYVHRARTDGGGAGYRRYDPAAYYAALSRAVRIVTDRLAPGPERDAYLRRWVRTELVGRMRSDAVRWLPEAQREAFFTGIRTTMRDAMPADMITRMPRPWRWPSALAATASTEEFLRVEDLLTSEAGSWADRSGSQALAGLVSPETLHEAARLLGEDPPLPTDRCARDRAQAHRRHRQRTVLRLLTAPADGRVHHRLVDWGRTPALLGRQVLAVFAPVAALAATLLAWAGTGTGAAVGVVAVTLLAVTATVVLSHRSLRGAGTALRHGLCLLPALPALIRAGATATWLLWALALALVVTQAGLERRWRARDIRAHPGRGAAGSSRPGWITTATTVTGVVIVAVTAVAVGIG